MDRYKEIVKGQMYGHVHEDYFTLVKGSNDQYIGVSHVNPSLTTYTFRTPTFRVYEMNAETFELMDYVQYSMDLEKSNKEGIPHWKESHRFTKYYEVPNMSVRSYKQLFKRMEV